MEQEHPDGQTTETLVYAHKIQERDGETRPKVTWMGMIKTGLPEEIFKDKYFSGLYTHRSGPSQGERKYLGSFTDCKVELGYSKQTP